MSDYDYDNNNNNREQPKIYSGKVAAKDSSLKLTLLIWIWFGKNLEKSFF